MRGHRFTFSSLGARSSRSRTSRGSPRKHSRPREGKRLPTTADRERDTPAELAAFREKRQLARERWTLLRGGADDVRELAALLGVNYAEDARGQFAHTNLITLLNADGEIAFQHAGLKQDPALLVAAIEKAARGAQR